MKIIGLLALSFFGFAARADTETALLRAIEANPGEDTPRLAYADFLEEKGDKASVARAEFIRLRIEMARWRGSRAWSGREVELLHEYEKLWAPKSLMAQGIHRTWERGFLSHLEISARQFADPEVRNDLDSLPFLVSLSIQGSENELVEHLNSLKASSRLRRLSLTNASLDNHAVATIKWAEMPHLVELDLSSNHIGDRGLIAIGDSPVGSRLRLLDLHGRELGWGAGPQGPPQYDNAFGRDGAVYLGSGRSFGNLELLNLSGTGIPTIPGFDRWLMLGLRKRPLPKLTQLYLRETAMSREDLLAFSATQAFRQLTTFNPPEVYFNEDQFKQYWNNVRKNSVLAYHLGLGYVIPDDIRLRMKANAEKANVYCSTVIDLLSDV